MSREVTRIDDPPEETDDGSENPSPLAVSADPGPTMHRDASLESKEGSVGESDTKASDDDDEKSSLLSDDLGSDKPKHLTKDISVDSKESFGEKTDTKASDEDELMKNSYALSQEATTGIEGSDVSSDTSVGATSTDDDFDLDTNEIDNLIRQLESLKVESSKSSKLADGKNVIKSKCKRIAERVVNMVTTESNDDDTDDDFDDEDDYFNRVWSEDGFADHGEKYEELRHLFCNILDDYRTYILTARRLNKIGDSEFDIQLDRVLANLKEVREDLNRRCNKMLQTPGILSDSKNLLTLIRNLSIHVDSNTDSILKTLDGNRIKSFYSGFAAFQGDYSKQLDIHRAATDTDLQNLSAFVFDMRTFSKETAKLRLTLDTWSNTPLPLTYIESWNSSMKYLATTALDLFLSFRKIRLNLKKNMSECCKYEEMISNNLSVFLGTEIDKMFYEPSPDY